MESVRPGRQPGAARAGGSECSVVGVNQATNTCMKLSVADTQDIPVFTYRWVKGTTHLEQPMMGK